MIALAHFHQLCVHTLATLSRFFMEFSRKHDFRVEVSGVKASALTCDVLDTFR